MISVDTIQAKNSTLLIAVVGVSGKRLIINNQSDQQRCRQACSSRCNLVTLSKPTYHYQIYKQVPFSSHSWSSSSSGWSSARKGEISGGGRPRSTSTTPMAPTTQQERWVTTLQWRILMITMDNKFRI